MRVKGPGISEKGPRLEVGGAFMVLCTGALQVLVTPLGYVYHIVPEMQLQMAAPPWQIFNKVIANSVG